MSLLQYFSVLRARRVVIFAILGATVAIVASVSIALPTTYTGTATVLVDVKSADTVGGAALGTALMPETLQAYMATQAEVISSERTAKKVIKALDLDQNAVFRERYAARSVEMITFEAWLVEDLGRRLEVRPSRDRNVIEITRSDADRKIAAQVANAFAQAYLETDLELKVEPARNSAAFFEERTKAVRSKLQSAQAKLTEFQRSRGILVTEERLDVENARLGELSSQLTGIQAAAVEAEAKEQNLDRLSDVIQSPLIQGLRADVAKAEARLREVSSQYGANHPLYQRTEAEVTALRGSLAAETARVGGTVVGGARINRQREARISAAYESQRKKVLTMKGARDEASMFVRDVENASKEYEALMTRLGQTNLESLVNRTNLTILNHATEPFYPSRPKILLNVVLAVFVGLVAGVATAFAMETLDRRVRDSNDLAEVLHLPVLGVLVPAAAGLPHGAQALRLPGAAPPPRAERDPSMHREGGSHIGTVLEGETTSGERSLIPTTRESSGASAGRQIGTFLVESGKLSVEGTEQVLRLQRTEGSRFGETALKLGLITETDLRFALAEQFDYPYLLPGDERIAPSVIAAYQPFDPRVEVFRELRAQLTLRWLDSQAGGRAFAVVSPGRGDGRSYLAANLGVVFAQLGERTLLIDADMRNPQQHVLFKLQDHNGLSAILMGRGHAGCIQRVAPFRDLSVIPAGGLPPNPQELLARPFFSQLLDELAQQFSVIIVDTPAGGNAADVQFICRSTSAALMVLRRNHTRAKTANRLIDQLGPTRVTVLGTVLNEF